MVAAPHKHRSHGYALRIYHADETTAGAEGAPA